MSARRFSPPSAILVALPLSLMLLACGGGVAWPSGWQMEVVN